MGNWFKAANMWMGLTLVGTATVAAQAVARMHPMKGGHEYFSGSLRLRGHQPNGDPFLVNPINPSAPVLGPGTFEVVQMIAADLSDEFGCRLTNTQQTSFSLAANDTIDVLVPVDFVYCSFRLHVNADSGAGGIAHLFAQQSIENDFNQDGEPILVTGPEIGYNCEFHDGDEEEVCDEIPDRAPAYGTQFVVTFTPDPGSQVVGRGPFGEVLSQPGQAVTYSGALDRSLYMDDVRFILAGSGPPALTVTAGGATPPAQTVAVGALGVPVLQFTLTPATALTLNSITLTASGSGNDQVDITAIRLYLDANGNGAVDGGEAPIASGTFSGNNGSATLQVSPAVPITTPTTFLVTYDFNLTLAQRFGSVATLALVPVLFWPVRRKRKGSVLLLLLLAGGAMISCGGNDSSGPDNSRTFKPTLTGVTVSGTPLTNVSVNGATITVAK